MNRQIFFLAVGIFFLNALPSLRYAAGQEDRPTVGVAEDVVEVADVVEEPSEDVVEAEAAPPDRQPISIDIAIVEYLGGEEAQMEGVDSLAKTEEWINALDEQKALLSLTRVTVSTVDGEQGMSQYGERAPVETGRTRVAVPRGRADVEVEVGDEADARRRRVLLQALPARNVAVSYNYEELGTIVRATPNVTGDGILLDLQIERSALSALRHPVEIEMEAGGEVPPPTIVRLQAESTLRLRDRKTRVAYRKSATSQHGLVEMAVLVTARLE